MTSLAWELFINLNISKCIGIIYLLKGQRSWSVYLFLTSSFFMAYYIITILMLQVYMEKPNVYSRSVA